MSSADPAARPALRHSLSARFAILAFAFAAGLALILVAVLAVGTWRTLVWQEEQVLLQRSEALYSWLGTTPIDEDNLFHEIVENVFEPREILMRVEDPALSEPMETPGFSDALASTLTDPAPTAPVEAETDFHFSPEGALYLSLLTARQIGEGDAARLVVVRGASNLTLDEKAFAGYLSFAGLLTLALILGAGVIQLVIGRWLLRPVQRITRETALVAPGTLDRRIDAAGLPSELAILAAAHNTMLDRLETAYHGLSTYADNAAHELRGPVGRMMAQTERLIDRDDLTPDVAEALDHLYDTAGKLRETLNAVLFLARADQGIFTILPQPVDVAAALAELRDLYDPALEDRGLTFTLDVEPGLLWPLDPRLFQQALSNLIENAIAHCPPGATVAVAARRGTDSLIVTVADDGPGIDPAHLPFVFDRFYRSDSVRQAGGGTGLGLAIVRSILRLHRGSATIDSRAGQGTTVTLTFGSAEVAGPPVTPRPAPRDGSATPAASGGT